MRRILLVLLLAGCGRSDVFREAQRAALVAPACVTTRGPSQLPRVRPAVPSDGGADIEWSRGECLDVTYGPGVEPFLNDVQVALAQWSGPDCTWMCFNAPVADASLPTGATRRRLHLRIAAAGELPPGTVMLTEVTFQQQTGELFHSQVMLDPAHKASLSNWLLQLGQALGFGRTQQESVLNPTLTRSALSSVDNQSVCAVYPACP